VPEDLDPAEQTVLLCAYPGGGYARGYYDIEWKDRRDYSEAEYHAKRGWIVACIDHLETGDSTVTGQLRMTDIATADAATARHIAAGLRDGSLVPDMKPVDLALVLAIGQSMGGHLLMLMQAADQPFDAVVFAGSSAIQTVLPTKEGAAMGSPEWFRYAFHGDADDPEMVEADQKGFLSNEELPWSSPTTPSGAVGGLQPGAYAGPAAAIEVPVYLVCGDRDVVANPRAEPAAYRSTNEIALSVFPQMGHMHNFSPTRTELWARVQAWGEALRHQADG
jgi:alpha-beta hydrolase superfamily lysophospholipase